VSNVKKPHTIKAMTLPARMIVAKYITLY